MILNPLSRFCRQKNPYKGVFSTFRDVPTAGPGFQGDQWLRQCQDRLAEMQRGKKEQGNFSPEFSNQAPLLALQAISLKGKSPLRILDFGGGLGFTFLPFSDMVGDLNFEYHIVDTPESCAQGRAAFHAEPRLIFHEKLPIVGNAFDIVYVRSTLQYIENYRSLIESLFAFKSNYFLFTHFSGVEGRGSFATAQRNVRGSVLPFWFISLEELGQIMAQGGYALRFKAWAEKTFLPIEAHAGSNQNYSWNLLYGN